jgi:hypothetical protein
MPVKDKNLAINQLQWVLGMRVGSLVETDDQVTMAMRLLYRCLKDDRVEPETAALIQTLIGYFGASRDGRPRDVVARELDARWCAIARIDAKNKRLGSLNYASQKLKIDRKNIREWRKEPEHEILVNKFIVEYKAGPQDD